MEVGFHEPGLMTYESTLIFVKIHKNIFMSVYRIDPWSNNVMPVSDSKLLEVQLLDFILTEYPDTRVLGMKIFTAKIP
jgi:hypothetical protein